MTVTLLAVHPASKCHISNWQHCQNCMTTFLAIPKWETKRKTRWGVVLGWGISVEYYSFEASAKHLLPLHLLSFFSVSLSPHGWFNLYLLFTRLCSFSPLTFFFLLISLTFLIQCDFGCLQTSPLRSRLVKANNTLTLLSYCTALFAMTSTFPLWQLQLARTWRS